MDGEKKLVIVAVGLVALCITVLYVFLFIALWDYRQFVGLSLLAVVLLAALIFLRGRWTEQELRVVRYRHHEETPLDERGEPLYWRQEYQANPHRQ
jgi:membrane protein implicated in regulation of membrane protease activity